MPFYIIVLQVILSKRFTNPEKEEIPVDRKNMDVAGKFIPYQPPEEPKWGDIDDNIKEKIGVSSNVTKYYSATVSS